MRGGRHVIAAGSCSGPALVDRGRWHDEIGRDGKALQPLVHVARPPKNIHINHPLDAETRSAFAHPSSKGI
jgi:hypothetical protein